MTARFSRDADVFDTAWRSDAPTTGTDPIRSMAAIRRVLGLSKQPIVRLGTPADATHVSTSTARAGHATAECGVGLTGHAPTGRR